MNFAYILNILSNVVELKSYDILQHDYNNTDLLIYLKQAIKQNNEIIELLKKGEKEMNEMETNNRSEYVTGGYRDYRGNYRSDYRGDYREDYDMRGGKMNNRSYRNYRNYREEDIYSEIEDAMYEAKECHRKMEDLSEMTQDPQMKNTLVKIAMREKEHYNSLKELLEK